MPDNNDMNESEFNFNSSENIKNPRKKEVLEKVLESYIDFSNDFKNLENDVSNIESELNNNKNKIDDNFESLKEKIIHLIEILKSKADKNYTHNEIKQLIDIVENIDSDIKELKDVNEDLEYHIDELSTDIENNASRIDKLENKNEELYSKMTQLANANISLRNEFNNFKKLNELKNKALDKSVTEAKCDKCDKKINILTLDKSSCPNCNMKFSKIKSNMIFPDILKN